MPKLWVPTQQHFDALVAWLSPDSEQAGAKYESIRQRLVTLFTWNGFSDAEDLADEAIDRVTKKLPELVETYTGDPALYFYGVAKKLLLERRRQEYARDEWELIEPRSCENPQEDDDSDSRLKCLDRCLQKLPQKNRQLILQYYQEEKREKIDFRLKLAQGVGVEVKTLRVRMHRIRTILHKCLEKCLAERGSMQ
jgi:DNA-directed RNA polymerase specialized sigma24 family protein